VAIGKEGNNDTTYQGLLSYDNLFYLGDELLNLLNPFIEVRFRFFFNMRSELHGNPQFGNHVLLLFFCN